MDMNDERDDSYTMQMKQPTENMSQLVKVPVEFRDSEEYYRIWTNLLELECLSQLKLENRYEDGHMLNLQ